MKTWYNKKTNSTMNKNFSKNKEDAMKNAGWVHVVSDKDLTPVVEKPKDIKPKKTKSVKKTKKKEKNA